MFLKIEEIIRNLLVYLFVIITVPPLSLLAIITRRHFIATFWCEVLLFLLGVKIKVFSKTQLSDKERYIFMVNHQSQLDIPVLEKVLKPYQIRFLAKRSLFNIPFFGWAIKALGYLPVERKDPKDGLKSILACIETFKKGYSLIIFPEGTRSKTGELLPFKLGGFLIPLKTKSKVVPLAIWGTIKILPKGKIWFKTSQKEVKVFIGEPIETSSFTFKEKDKLSLIVREQITEGLELLKTEFKRGGAL
ncbi:MAG: 1-acyl-sn-glycerol-3-phosphate acyltransferase [Thermodesulfobacteriaceae bacterium]|nr:1-acyl-sn-glycerol-3-phosphate acyltransferase [Thermodesulfobacteriaceae bacterium]MCX8040891.1 1-acyl-sn-glycerol-3-phosphate acyltransferase [Thermodesulfobacteriaceae bacterium]MDW8135228.1 lysophospholipid acyltransferase family protein [Thermodesulfobacterium sp.]